MSGLRVLVVPKWYPWAELPVWGLFCREHALALATRHDVVVLPSLATRSPAFASWRIEDSLEEGLRTVRVRYRRPLARPAAMAFQTAGMLVALRRLAAEGWRPDVVHAHVYSAAPPALLLGMRARAPVVVTEHYTGFARGLVTGYDRWLARTSFERADLVAPVSHDLAATLRELAPRARMEVVPNVVDTRLFSPRAARDERAPGPPRLLCVADLAEKKGHRFLLDALAEIADARLDLVGEGPEHEPLLAQARRLGIAERVRLLGGRPPAEVAALMRAADLFVLPSLHENLPVVLIEAQASGLPAVATRVGGVPELVDDRAGTLVGARDASALRDDASALRDAIVATLARLDDFDGPELANRAAERWSHAAIAQRWTDLYESL